ncbi:MAG: endonuclease/exonuclease/phosphatase family protein [Pirellulales bacterium]
MTSSSPPLISAHPDPIATWIKRVAVLLSTAIVAVAGAGTVLGFAARHSWRLELAAHFRVQYFWALVAAMIILALARRKVMALVAATLAMTNLALIAPLYFGPAPRADAGPPLRAISFNVHYLNEDYAATIELIVTELPDFVLLLEVTPEWAEALTFLKVDYPYEHVMAKAGSGGMAFYSRREITDLSVHELADVGQSTIVVGLAVPVDRLTLVCTHLVSPRTAHDFENRNRQLEEVGQLARARSGAVMLLGDLNTTSWSPYFQDLLTNSGLRDSRRGFGVEPSWPWLTTPLLRIPIDHCLVSAAVSVLDRRIGPAVGSDHRPLLVDFAITAP